MSSELKNEPSLHFFLSKLYGTKSREESLIKLRDIFVEVDIAKSGKKNIIEFNVYNDELYLDCINPEKRSRRFINSEDEALGSRRTPNDCIREFLYNKFCEIDFAILKSIAGQFLDAWPSSKFVNEMAKDILDNCFENMEDNKTVFKYIRNLDDNTVKLAWLFIFLCFPRVPSGSHVNYRNLILKAMRLSPTIDIILQPYNVTDNDHLIAKVPAVDIGRAKEIEEIRSKMLANNTIFVHGIRGIGTTFIGRKLFWDYYNKYSDGIEYLAWIHYSEDLEHSLDHAFSRNEIDTSVVRNDLYNHPVVWNLYDTLSKEQNLITRVNIIKKFFSELGSRILVIIDDADAINSNEINWLNTCRCRMIVTTNQHHNSDNYVFIDKLSSEYCMEMYVNIVFNKNKEIFNLQEKEYIQRIIALADYHTQTIMLIANAQNSCGYSAQEMYENLRESGFVLKNTNETIQDIYPEKTMAEHLTKIFNISCITDEEQIKALRLFSLLAPNTAIKKQDMKKLFNLSSLSTINQLAKSSWLNKIGSQYVSIHPVIADVIRYRYPPDFGYAESMTNALIELMNLAKDFRTKSSIIEHCVSIYAIFKGNEGKKYIDLVGEIADNYEKLADYVNGIKYYTKQLNLLSDNSNKKADVFNNLAITYNKNEQYDEALICELKALTLYTRQLGINTNAVISENDNIRLLMKQRKYSEAISSFTMLLSNDSEVTNILAKQTTSEKAGVFANVLMGCFNIASLYTSQGQFELSSHILLNILKILDVFPVIEISAVGNIYNTLAIDFEYMGKTNEAFNYYFKTIETIGGDSICSAKIFANLGGLYSETNDFVKAIDYYNRALELFKRYYGNDDYHTAEILYDIAGVYFNQGDCDSALSFLNSALDIFVIVYGDEHKRTIEVCDKIKALEEMRDQ